MKEKIAEAKAALEKEGAAWEAYRADSEAEYKARQQLCVLQERAHKACAALLECVDRWAERQERLEGDTAALAKVQASLESQAAALDKRAADLAAREAALPPAPVAQPAPNAAPPQGEPAPVE